MIFTPLFSGNIQGKNYSFFLKQNQKISLQKKYNFTYGNRAFSCLTVDTYGIIPNGYNKNKLNLFNFALSGPTSYSPPQAVCGSLYRGRSPLTDNALRWGTPNWPAGALKPPKCKTSLVTRNVGKHSLLTSIPERGKSAVNSKPLLRKGGTKKNQKIILKSGVAPLTVGCLGGPLKKGKANAREKNTDEKSFWNQTFDKSRLKNFVLWFLSKHGEYKTVKLVEELKTLGFQYATKAGISLGIEDLKIPIKKNNLIMEAEQLSIDTIKQYKRSEITGVERFQRLIDTWHRTSERLKQEVIENFEATDILNPVYMMAFSGARGNISQVRQLVGMRGLMSNPQGQIIDFPIRSNFREGLTLTEYIISSYGARKGIVDTALRTANAGYLTRRLVDVAQHVIISNFDCGSKRGIFLNDMKEGNKTIYSLQNRLIGRVLARDVYSKKLKTQIPFSLQVPDFAAAGSDSSKNLKPLDLPMMKIIKVASRNVEISSELAISLASICKKVFVRSALTCQTKNLVCQLCYGWSLAQGNLVGIGEAVGVVAAQSIGEPGTQLTMRTFHTGGVFSGDVSDQIRASFNGIVTYDNPIAGTLIRTPEGKIAFLTKNEGSFKVQSISSLNQKSIGFSEIKKFKIPFYTLLFFKNGEKVLEKEVIAQISSINRQKSATDQAELTINAELSGQFFSKFLNLKENKVGPKLKGSLAYKSYNTDSLSIIKNLETTPVAPVDCFANARVASPTMGPAREKKSSGGFSGIDNLKSNKKIKKQEILVEQFDENIVDTIFESWGWGYAWVLSGKIYQLPLASTFFPIIGDFVNNKTYMNKNQLSLPSNFGSALKLNIQFPNSAGHNVFFNKKIIKQMRLFSPLYLSKAKSMRGNTVVKKNSTSSLNSLSYNQKNFSLLKTELISFQLSKIIYQKIGYFIKLNSNYISSSSAVESSDLYDKKSSIKISPHNISRSSILSEDDNLFSSLINFSRIKHPNQLRQITTDQNFKEITSSNSFLNLEESRSRFDKNKFLYPANWPVKKTFDIFLNWFPKRFSTKSGGLILLEPIVLTNTHKSKITSYYNVISKKIHSERCFANGGLLGKRKVYNTRKHSQYFIKNLNFFSPSTSISGCFANGVSEATRKGKLTQNIKFFPTFFKRDLINEQENQNKSSLSYRQLAIKNFVSNKSSSISPINSLPYQGSKGQSSFGVQLNFENKLKQPISLVFEQYQLKDFSKNLAAELLKPDLLDLLGFNEVQTKRSNIISYLQPSNFIESEDLNKSQNPHKNILQVSGNLKIKSQNFMSISHLNWKNSFKINFFETSALTSNSKPTIYTKQKIESLQRIFWLPQFFYTFSFEKFIFLQQISSKNNNNFFSSLGLAKQPTVSGATLGLAKQPAGATILNLLNLNPYKILSNSSLINQIGFYSDANIQFIQINRQGKIKNFKLIQGIFEIAAKDFTNPKESFKNFLDIQLKNKIGTSSLIKNKKSTKLKNSLRCLQKYNYETLRSFSKTTSFPYFLKQNSVRKSYNFLSNLPAYIKNKAQLNRKGYLTNDTLFSYRKGNADLNKSKQVSLAKIIKKVPSLKKRISFGFEIPLKMSLFNFNFYNFFNKQPITTYSSRFIKNQQKQKINNICSPYLKNQIKDKYSSLNSQIKIISKLSTNILIEQRKKHFQIWLKKFTIYLNSIVKNYLKNNLKAYFGEGVVTSKLNILNYNKLLFSKKRARYSRYGLQEKIQTKNKKLDFKIKNQPLDFQNTKTKFTFPKLGGSFNLITKPGWLYFSNDISKFFLYHKKLIQPGKMIANDLIFDNQHVYLEILDLNTFFDISRENLKNYQLDFSNDFSLEYKLDKTEKNSLPRLVASPTQGLLRQRWGPQGKKIIKNKKCRFLPNNFTACTCNKINQIPRKPCVKPCINYKEINPGIIKKPISFNSKIKENIFLILVRTANEYKLFNDSDYKKEIYRIANEKNTNLNFSLKNSFNIKSPISQSNNNTSNKKILSFQNIFNQKNKDQSIFLKINNGTNTFNLWKQFKTGLLNKQKLSSQTLAKFPSPDLKVFSNISFYSSLITLKQTLTKNSIFYESQKLLTSLEAPIPLEGISQGVLKDNPSGSVHNNFDQINFLKTPFKTSLQKNELVSNQNLSKYSQSLMSYSSDIFWKYNPITAISPINLSPLIISSEIPYSFDFLFKEPIRFFSEQQNLNLIFARSSSFSSKSSIYKNERNFSTSSDISFSRSTWSKPIKKLLNNYLYKINSLKNNSEIDPYPVSLPSQVSSEYPNKAKVTPILSSLFFSPIAEYSLSTNFEKSILYPNNLTTFYPIQNTNLFSSNINNIYNRNFLISSDVKDIFKPKTQLIASKTFPLVLGSLNNFLDFRPKYRINKEIFLYKTEFESFNNNQISSLSNSSFINTYTYCSFEGELIFKTLGSDGKISTNHKDLYNKKQDSVHSSILQNNISQEKDNRSLKFSSLLSKQSRITKKSKDKSVKFKSDKITADIYTTGSYSNGIYGKNSENALKNLENSLFLNKRLVDSCMILTKKDQLSYYLNKQFKNSDFLNNTTYPIQEQKKFTYKQIYYSLETIKNKNKYIINDTVIKFLNILENVDTPNILPKVPEIANQENISNKVQDLNNLENQNDPFSELNFKLNKLPIGLSQQTNSLLLGEFLVYGDRINPYLSVTKPGQIIHINDKKITMRYGQPIFVSPKAILHKYDNDFIEEQSPVITLSYQQLKTGDIIQGIPKVEQFFEARTTKRGRLFRDSLANLLKALFKRYSSKGQPFDQAVRQSFYKIQQIIVDGVQRVYRSQGVSIADKHLEVIVKQMTSKVRILEGGQTGFFPGEVVDLILVEEVNNLLMKKITYEPLVLGITKASLEVDSFLSAASFQQTTKVLTNAAISKKKDFLKGLKENVILGNLIPAGTGYLVYLNK